MNHHANFKMKKFTLSLVVMLLLLVFQASATIVTITNSGLVYTPDSIAINFGDTVDFVLTGSHPTREVSKATWDVNGTTLLPGGFDITNPTGGRITGLLPGNHYYVCTNHAGAGMKGIITVNPVPFVTDMVAATANEADGTPTNEDSAAAVSGIVYSTNNRTGSQYSFVLIHHTIPKGQRRGITIFANPGSSYLPQVGDSVTVYSKIGFFNGLTQLGGNGDVIDTVVVHRSGVPLQMPTMLNGRGITETDEGDYLRLQNVTYQGVTVSSWRTTGSFNFEVQDAASNTYTVRVEGGTAASLPMAFQTEPTIGDPLNLWGFGGQFDNSAPHDAGYQFVLDSIDVGFAGGFRLTVLHNNDGESSLVDAGIDDFGGVARFKSLVDTLRNEGNMVSNGGSILLSSGDNFLAGTAISASFARPATADIYDAIALDSLNYDALCIGNHDFDFGPAFLARFIEDFTGSTPPFLSSNLNFSTEPALAPLATSGRIKPFHIVEVDGDSVGVIGLTTPLLNTISSPGNVGIGMAVADSVNKYATELTNLGVNKIILISHLQGIAEDTNLIPLLSDVDIVIAGGGDELLANPSDVLLPGSPAPAGPYPLYTKDAEGDSVPVVTTEGNYRYVGRLVVEFDAMGNISLVDPSSGPRRVSGVGADSVPENPYIKSNVTDSIIAFEAGLDTQVVAITNVEINGVRNNVRTRQTNMGDLMADALLWEARRSVSAFGVPRADVAVQNGGGIRNDVVIAAGDTVTRKSTFDAFPFSNFVTVVDSVPVMRLKKILEEAYNSWPTPSGGFAQIAGMTIDLDTNNVGIELDFSNSDVVIPVVVPGTRVVNITLEDGTVILQDGMPTANARPINMAVVDFAPRNNGDGYDFNGLNYTLTGTTYQKAFENFLIDSLGGLVDGADYPTFGDDRIRLIDSTGNTIPDIKVKDADGVFVHDGATVTVPAVAVSADFESSGSRANIFVLDTRFPNRRDLRRGIIVTITGSGTNVGDTIQPGDSLLITGTLGQFNGADQISVDADANIVVVQEGIDISGQLRRMNGKLGELDEGDYILFDTVTYVGTSNGKWGSSSDYTFDVRTINGDTNSIRVEVATNIGFKNEPAVGDTLRIIGGGTQFDPSVPLSSGYQLAAIDSGLFLNYSESGVVPAPDTIRSISLARDTTSPDRELINNGEIAVVSGTVISRNVRSGGLQFFIEDLTLPASEMRGIGYFEDNTNQFAYTPEIGDSVTIIGTIGQFRGLAQISSADNIIVHKNVTTPVWSARTKTTPLNESDESELLLFEELIYAGSGGSWSATGDFSATATLPTGETIDIRVIEETGVGALPEPNVGDTLRVIGYGGQFDPSNPLTEGYQFTPIDAGAIFFTVNPVSAKELILNEGTVRVYPNPARQNVNIRYELTQEANITIQVVNTLGKVVAAEPSVKRLVGEYTTTLDLTGIASGVYYIQLMTEKEVVNKAITVE